MLLDNNTESRRKFVAWSKARLIPGWPSYRQDCDGRWICWSDYGKNGTYGWQIDHILPRSLGGSDLDHNLRARHWLGNTSAGGILGRLMAG